MRKKRDSNGGSYGVGYGKPPIETRWQPGQSGNPKGRKKGTKNLLTIVQEIADEKIVLKQNGKSRKVTVKEGLVRATSMSAANGDKNARSVIFNLIAQAEAKEQAVARRGRPNIRTIDPSMTPREAADAYAQTLAEINAIMPIGNTDWETE